MGWEPRGNRLYLYRNVRVCGRPVKEYLGTADTFAGLVPLPWERQPCEGNGDQRQRSGRRNAAETGIDGLLVELDRSSAHLRAIVEGVLTAVGFHRHHRGEWRMRRKLKGLADSIQELRTTMEKQKPLLNYSAPAGDTEAIEVFAKARAGDTEALARVQEIIVDRNWVSWVGDIARQATFQLIDKAAAGDPVWKAGLAEKANALRRELLGSNPSALDDLLVRRVVNGWLTTHTIEMEVAVRRPTTHREREQLDRELTRAQKRMTDAVRELARVRRLALPDVLAQVNITQTPPPQPPALSSRS